MQCVSIVFSLTGFVEALINNFGNEVGTVAPSDGKLLVGVVCVRACVHVFVCMCVCVHIYMTTVVFVAVIHNVQWWKFFYGTMVLLVCLIICLVGAGTVICIPYCTCIHMCMP